MASSFLHAILPSGARFSALQTVLASYRRIFQAHIAHPSWLGLAMLRFTGNAIGRTCKSCPAGSRLPRRRIRISIPLLVVTFLLLSSFLCILLPPPYSSFPSDPSPNRHCPGPSILLPSSVRVLHVVLHRQFAYNSLHNALPFKARQSLPLTEATLPIAPRPSSPAPIVCRTARAASATLKMDRLQMPSRTPRPGLARRPRP